MRQWNQDPVMSELTLSRRIEPQSTSRHQQLVGTNLGLAVESNYSTGAILQILSHSMRNSLDSYSAQFQDERPPTFPAWLMSVVVHLLALVSFALFYQGATRTLPSDVVDERPVSVVLARADINDEVEYFEQTDEVAPVSHAAQPSSESPPLPSDLSDSPPLDVDIKLPGPLDANIGESLSDSLVAVPSLDPAARRPILPGEGDAEILAEELARRKKNAGPKGPPGEVGIFGSGGVAGHSFVFVIDRSKSMGSQGLGVLSAARHELQMALARLKENHQFQIIAYHHKTVMVHERRLLKATDENKEKVVEFFAGLAAFGSTSHESALYSALRLKPDVIFFLNDGGDPHLNASQIDQITSRAGRRTTIHCLQFGLGPNSDKDNFMMKLARRNRGTYRYVDMAKR